MQEGKFYRVLFDSPQHDLTVKALKPSYFDDDYNCEIVVVHSGNSWHVGNRLNLHSDYLERLEETGAPVTDGKYLGKDGMTYYRIDGQWFKPDTKSTAYTDGFVNDTLTKVED